MPNPPFESVEAKALQEYLKAAQSGSLAPALVSARPDMLNSILDRINRELSGGPEGTFTQEEADELLTLGETFTKAAVVATQPFATRQFGDLGSCLLSLADAIRARAE